MIFKALNNRAVAMFRVFAEFLIVGFAGLHRGALPARITGKSCRNLLSARIGKFLAMLLHAFYKPFAELETWAKLFKIAFTGNRKRGCRIRER